MKRISLIPITIALTSCINIISSTNLSEAPIEERTFPITEQVTAIAASHGADVIVDPTLAASEMRVTTHTDIFDILECDIKNETLSIGLTSNSLRAKTFEVRIPILAYKDIAVSGGSDFKWNNCVAEELSIAASGGADVDITSQSSKINLAISGGADAEISGRCITLVVAASGGADASLEELIANDVTVAASGGADVTVHATESLVVEASGGADVAYTGNPTTKDINRSGGADVYRID
jgi:hypothetical protein